MWSSTGSSPSSTSYAAVRTRPLHAFVCVSLVAAKIAVHYIFTSTCWYMSSSVNKIDRSWSVLRRSLPHHPGGTSPVTVSLSWLVAGIGQNSCCALLKRRCAWRPMCRLPWLFSCSICGQPGSGGVGSVARTLCCCSFRCAVLQQHLTLIPGTDCCFIRRPCLEAAGNDWLVLFRALMMQTLNVTFWLVPNAALLSSYCHWYSNLVDTSGFIRWCGFYQKCMTAQ